MAGCPGDAKSNRFDQTDCLAARENVERLSPALSAMVTVFLVQYPVARLEMPRARSGFQGVVVLEERFVVGLARTMSLLRTTEEDSNGAADHRRVMDVESNANCRMVCPQGLEFGLARLMGAPVFRY